MEWFFILENGFKEKHQKLLQQIPQFTKIAEFFLEKTMAMPNLEPTQKKLRNHKKKMKKKGFLPQRP